MPMSARERIEEAMLQLSGQEQRTSYRVCSASPQPVQATRKHVTVTPAAGESPDERLHIVGYGSTFGNLYEAFDWWMGSFLERMNAGAFRRTLVDNADMLRGLWMHRQSDPIASFDEIFEDPIGLRFDMALGRTTSIEERFTLVEDGIVRGTSIGFGFRDYRIHEDGDESSDGEFFIEHDDVDLYEISLVTWQANGLANVTEVLRAMELGIPAKQIVDVMLEDVRRFKRTGRRIYEPDTATLLREIEHASQYVSRSDEHEVIAKLNGNESEQAFRRRFLWELNALQQSYYDTIERL